MILIPYVLLWSTPIVAYHVVKFKPQILHCRNLLSSFVAVFLQKLLGFKYSVIADPRSVYPEELIALIIEYGKKLKNGLLNMQMHVSV